VEYGMMPSFPSLTGDQRLLLAESVAAVIEVKSDLSKQWKEVMKTTCGVKQLQRRLGPAITQSSTGAPSAGRTIPVYAVGYMGYGTAKRLHDCLRKTDPDSRPDAALVIDPGILVSPPYMAEGSVALYGLCWLIHSRLNELVSATPNMLAYVCGEPEDSGSQGAANESSDSP
jgi:hypothetical protein